MPKNWTMVRVERDLSIELKRIQKYPKESKNDVIKRLLKMSGGGR